MEGYTARIREDENGNEYLSFSKQFISDLEKIIETRVLEKVIPVIQATNKEIADKIDEALKSIEALQLNGLWNTKKIEEERIKIENLVQSLRKEFVFKFE